jgi:hypothetical protein
MTTSISAQNISQARASGSTSGQGATLEQVTRDLLSKGEKYARTYTAKAQTEGNGGAISKDDVLAQIRREFSEYTIVNRAPKDVTPGQNQLYIDDANLQKMADDPAYRGKVFGLMRRELDGAAPMTLRGPGGKDVSIRATGTVFSLSNDNETVDGVPYSGMAASESSATVSSSSSGDSKGVAKSLDASRTSLREWMERKHADAVEVKKREAARAAAKKDAAAAAESAPASSPIPGAKAIDGLLEGIRLTPIDREAAANGGESFTLNGATTRFSIVV